MLRHRRSTIQEIQMETSNALNKVTALAHQAVDKAAGAAVPAADWLTDRTAKLDATQKKLVADTGSYVVANPLKAIAIAALAGFLVSRLV
jgi:ElaB/YqjD/DUF883 family membrane-anchored ribosome-binding protein